jgi:hypothetical protein
MRTSVTFNVVVVGLVAGLASVCACSSRGVGGSGKSTSTGGGGGSGGLAGAADGGTAGAAGQSAAGATGAGGAGGSGGLAGAADGGSAGAAGQSAAGAAGTGTAGTTVAPGPVSGAITKVLPTTGCGMDPGQAIGMLVMHTIQTMGTKDAKCADSKCGAWGPYPRDYWLRLPTGYDKTKAYPLVFEWPGCASYGNNLYNIPIFDMTVIRVGLSPSADAMAFHATNPGGGCFDDHEGDDSVDWVFYENLYDMLGGTLCFDRNRVFSAGNRSGAWLSNELGCKYAGDATRPIRGIMPRAGGLPTDPRYVPTCTDKPMAGMWVYEISDGTNPFTGSIVAMNRALMVNGCTPAGVTFQTATFDPFPISATDSTSCKKFKGCPDLYPLVVCPLLGISQDGTNDSVVNPGWSTFITLFENPPLLTP